MFKKLFKGKYISTLFFFAAEKLSFRPSYSVLVCAKSGEGGERGRGERGVFDVCNFAYFSGGGARGWVIKGGKRETQTPHRKRLRVL